MQVLAAIAIAVGLALLLRAFVLARSDGGAASRRARQRIAGTFLVITAGVSGKLLNGVLDDALVIGGMLALGMPGLLLLFLARRRQSA